MGLCLLERAVSIIDGRAQSGPTGGAPTQPPAAPIRQMAVRIASAVHVLSICNEPSHKKSGELMIHPPAVCADSTGKKMNEKLMKFFV
jgi:hypothetical protein